MSISNGVSIFHAYDIRGIYPSEINAETAYRVGLAFGKYLREDLKKDPPLQVVLGLDMRGSSPFLAKEVMRAFLEQGIDVIEIGKVPTPAFYYAVAFKNYSAGIMITASHMTREYNGFKLCREKAIPIAKDSGIEKIKQYVEAANPADNFQSRLKFKGKMLSIPDATRQYVEQELSYVNVAKIKKLKIAADTANCMGALYLEEFFNRIPCEPIKINWELNGNMPVHEANPIKLETLQQLQAVMKNEGADFGIATDGDGDRIAFLDETAEVIPSFIVQGLVAQSLLKKYPGSSIGYDLRSSRVLKEMILAAGGEPVETIVGHSFVKILMTEKNILFSGELSGHYYFPENFNFESPVFVVAELLLLRSLEDKPFSEIWRPYLKYAHSGEINFDVADKQAVIDRLEKKYADGKISKADGLKVDYPDWWFNVRPSANDPVLRLNLEANDEKTMKEKLEELKKEITSWLKH